MSLKYSLFVLCITNIYNSICYPTSIYNEEDNSEVLDNDSLISKFRNI